MDNKLGRRAILVATVLLTLFGMGAWAQNPGGPGRGGPRDREEMLMQRRERLRALREDMRREEQARFGRRMDMQANERRSEPVQPGQAQPRGWRDLRTFQAPEGVGSGQMRGADPQGFAPPGNGPNGARRGEQLRHLSPEERQQLREQMRDAAREVYGK